MSNATIDTNAFISKTAEANCSNIATSLKSYDGMKSSFSDALSSANENYSDKTKYVSNVQSSFNTQKNLNNDVNDTSSVRKEKFNDDSKSSAKKDSKDSVDKVSDKNDDKNQSVNSKDDSTKVKSSREDKSDKVSKKDDETDSKATKQSPKEDNSVKSDDNNKVASADDSSQAEAQEVQSASNDVAQVATVAENAVSEATTQSVTDIFKDVKSQTENLSAETISDSTKTDVVKDAKINESLKELNSMARNANNAEASAENTPKIQTQTQQLLANVQNGQAEVQTQREDASVQTPLVQVGSDVSEMSKSSDKQTVQTMLDKAGLTQDLLDKTNAKITSVTTNAQMQADLSNGQDATEQSLKFSIEQNSAITTQSVGAKGESSVQATFDKTLATSTKPQNLSDSEILSQINNKLQTANEETGNSRITMILKPESLGKIHLELLNGKDGLTASFTAENAQVKEALDKNLDSLKNTLASQGLNVSNVSVKVENSEKNQGADLQNQEQSDNQENNSKGQTTKDNNSNYEKEQARAEAKDNKTSKKENEFVIK